MYSLRLSAALLICAALAYPQTLKFEVASVRPAAVDARGLRCSGGPGTTEPGQLTCENYSLSLLVMMAYDLRGFQLAAPGWMDTARFNVTAKIPPGTDRKQFEVMQQALLAERFGLQAHFQKKDMTVYVLTVGKGGPKLTASKEPEMAKSDGLWKPPASGPPGRTMASVTRKADSMSELAYFLSNQLGQPVTDGTGLTGRYDYVLKFLMVPGGRAAGPTAIDGPAPEAETSLFDAVRELGLQLEKQKGQSDMLVVDHAEKVPVEN